MLLVSGLLDKYAISKIISAIIIPRKINECSIVMPSLHYNSTTILLKKLAF